MFGKCLFFFIVLISIISQTYAAIDGGQCRLSSLETPGLINVNHPFVINAYDDTGNPLATGGSIFDADIDGGAAVGPIIDNNDGTYTSYWSASFAGNYLLTVALVGTFPDDETEIMNSPFSVVAFDSSVSVSNSASAPNSDPCTTTVASKRKSFATGCGVQGTLFAPNCCVGQPASFTVYLRDYYGNFVCHGGYNVTAVVSKPLLIPFSSFTLTNNLDGTYTGSYIPNVAGLWTVSIKLNNKQLLISPYLPIFFNC